MLLQLKRPLVVFDLETTGISTSKDRIVEIFLLKIHPSNREETRHYLVNPTIPIPPEVTAIHGISDRDVEGKPCFADIAGELFSFLEGCDFGGFNSNKFDFPMLLEEFYRAGKDFDLTKSKFIDAQRIFHAMEPRNLKAAYQFYCGKDLEQAHTAEADARATWEILQSQLDRYKELEPTIEYLHKFSGQGNNLDLAGRIVVNERGDEIFNFGKHKGQTLREVFQKEPQYYEWMMKGDFSENTKRVITRTRLKYFGRKDDE